MYQELLNCLDFLEPIDGKPLDEVVGSLVILSAERLILKLYRCSCRLLIDQFLIGRESEMCIFFFEKSA